MAPNSPSKRERQTTPPPVSNPISDVSAVRRGLDQQSIAGGALSSKRNDGGSPTKKHKGKGNATAKEPVSHELSDDAIEDVSSDEDLFASPTRRGPPPVSPTARARKSVLDIARRGEEEEDQEEESEEEDAIVSGGFTDAFDPGQHASQVQRLCSGRPASQAPAAPALPRQESDSSDESRPSTPSPSRPLKYKEPLPSVALPVELLSFTSSPGFAVTRDESGGVSRFGSGAGGREGRKPGEWTIDRRCSLEQKRIIERFIEGGNVFITGSAGVGKSFILQQIRNYCNHMGRPFQVCATTGIASLNVEGTTIHSWACIGLGEKAIYELFGRIIGTKGPRGKNWMSTVTQVLIIDEISMLGLDLFTKLSLLGKLVREHKGPFGGLQIVVCGDFFQLPPVPDESPNCIRCGKGDTLKQGNTPAKKNFEEVDIKLARIAYEAPIPGNPAAKILRCRACGLDTRARSFAFETEAWVECNFEIIELTKIFRQDNPDMITRLEHVRRGSCSNADRAFLTSGGSALQGAGVQWTNLYPRRESVNKENNRIFDELPSPPYSFTALDSSCGPSGADYLDDKRLNRAPATVELKIGAQVMLLVNLDVEHGLANGSLGIVEKGKLPVVRFDCGVTKTISAHSWTIDINSQHSVARTQLPLQLAWALTIHKSQGQTLQRVRVVLDKTFEAGQAYVALSRATSLEGLLVEGLDKKLIYANPIETAFYAAVQRGSPFKAAPPEPINPLFYCKLGVAVRTDPRKVKVFGKAPICSPAAGSAFKPPSVCGLRR